MTEFTRKYTNNAIGIIADYIQRASKNEQLQEAKTRLDKKIILFFDDGNCDLSRLMSAFVPAMTSYTRERFFEEIALAAEEARS
ncbi:hypothetical protein [Citrobacter cronae]|uniref:hypothetical protein n=1 Tax=Citrobacter cronae TaxID=1748967 RepID=UPI001C102B1E|nr:hypothetical protein [Citrobacter cronae]MBU5384803.1 hypothetical protein [Citrobacter cronae]